MLVTTSRQVLDFGSDPVEMTRGLAFGYLQRLLLNSVYNITVRFTSKQPDIEPNLIERIADS